MNDEIEEMWATYRSTSGAAPNGRDTPHSAWHFCDNKADADALAELVLEGRKRATAGCAWSYEAEKEPLPRVGDHNVITDWEGRPRVIIRTTAVEVVPFGQVTAEFAAAEGEGDLSLAYWREAHWAAFSRELARIGREPAEDMSVVCERFEAVFPAGLDGGPIEVSKATAEDAALLAELGARTFRDTFAADNTEADMASYLAGAFSSELQGRDLADERTVFLIGQADGTPAGYTRLRFAPAPECVGGERPMEIARFYADLPWIGRGLGAVLMKAALSMAEERDCDVVWLDVWERNSRAIAFYTKWGFAQVGRQAFILGDDIQDDLLMTRKVR